jgi:hypothetical protein
VNQLGNDLTQVLTDAQTLSNVKTDQLKSSIQGLQQSVQNIDDSRPVASAIATLVPQAVAIGQAISQAELPSCS